MIRTDDPLYDFHIWFSEQKLAQSIDWALAFKKFQNSIWSFYSHKRRDFPWRNTIDPYAIVVSEIMLQQTQTQRVVQKYHNFLEIFSTFNQLAQADVQELLRVWVGLGYNRRAFALQSIAQTVVNDYGGILPDDPLELQMFKGIGPATAASIVAFVYNKPTVFIETNIRAIFLHTFYSQQEGVLDKAIESLVAATVDKINPREWYYALMDYGVCIKKLYPNPSRKSKHHTTQSAFKGSDRQVRGAIIKEIAQHGICSFDTIDQKFTHPSERIQAVFDDLCKEQLIIYLSVGKYVFKTM